jgi:site-specific recombinase XerD
VRYLNAIGRARNTLRSYAQSLALYFTYLAQEQLDYQQVTLDELSGFVLWLKNPYRSLFAQSVARSTRDPGAYQYDH